MDLDIDPKGSVSQFFDRLMILTLQNTYGCEPYWEGDLHYDKDSGRPLSLIPCAGGPIKLWLTLQNNLPKPDDYCVGTDVATGTGATPSCLTVGSATTGEKVCEYRNPFILPEKFAVFAVAMCWLFKNLGGDGAMMAWETPGPGYTFGKTVMDLGYRNVYYKVNEFKQFADESDEPGWYNSPTTKRHLLEEYRAALHARQFLNRSKNALVDCLAFKYDKKGMIEHALETSVIDPSGARSNHADVVIGDALCWKLIKKHGLPERKKPIDTVPILSLQWRRNLADRQAREAASL